MPDEAKLILIPKFTRIEGTDVGVAAMVTKPVDVSKRGAVRFGFGRGPIETADPIRARFELRIEESPDGKSWSSSPASPEISSPKAHVSGLLPQEVRHRWVRARVEFQGKSVMCWAESVATE